MASVHYFCLLLIFIQKPIHLLNSVYSWNPKVLTQLSLYFKYVNMQAKTKSSHFLMPCSTKGIYHSKLQCFHYKRVEIYVCTVHQYITLQRSTTFPLAFFSVLYQKLFKFPLHFGMKYSANC